MSQKSEAIGLMVRNGVTDIGTMKQMWDDMDGRKKKKPSYAEWVKGVNPLFVGPDYNLKAAYDELPFETMEAWRRDPNANHLPDTYKLPSHPTFSLESKDPVTGMKGGAWLGDRFYPSQANRLFNPDIYPHSGAYMELPYGYMVPETIQLPKTKLSFAEGGFTSPDHDPNNPYHYHVNGQKVVVTPEDWEKFKDDPTFREVRAAIEAEQAAHPGPEYDEVENPAWRTAYQRIGVTQNTHWNGSKFVLPPLPDGYSRDSRGVAMDANGNYYAPVKDMSYWNPNVPFFVNNERSSVNGNTVPVRYEQVQMPEKTIRQLRQPLPVDRVMNIEGLREDSIDRYIKDNTKQTVQTLYKAPTYYPSENSFERLDNDEMDAYIEWLRNESKKFPQVITKKELKDWFITAEEMGEDLTDDINVYSPDEDIERGINKYISVPQNKVQQKKKYIPSRKEAEKKAVISIGDFAQGGKLDGPPDKNPILGAMMQIPDIYMDWRYGKYPTTETANNAFLEAMAIADNSVIGDKVENVLFKVPKFGKYLGGGYHLFRGLNDYGIPVGVINDASDLLTGKSGIEHIGVMLEDSDEVAANMLRTNIAKSNISFADGGSIDDPPSSRFTFNYKPLTWSNYVKTGLNRYHPDLSNFYRDTFTGEKDTKYSALPKKQRKIYETALSNLYKTEDFNTFRNTLQANNIASDWLKYQDIDNPYSKFTVNDLKGQYEYNLYQAYQNQLLEEAKNKYPTAYTEGSKEAINAANFIDNYYNSKGYQQRASRYGISTSNPLPSNITVNIEDFDNDKPSRYLFRLNDVGSRASFIDEGNDIKLWNNIETVASPLGVAAHEYAHLNPLYNTRTTNKVKTVDSPYYGMDYSSVPQRYKDILIGEGYTDDHDKELNENYSDLMGLRAELQKAGIFDSFDGSIFDENLLQKVKDSGIKNRFLEYHTDQQIIDALNEIADVGQSSIGNYAAKGGKLDIPPDKKPAIHVGGYLPDYYPSQQEWLRNWFGNREEQIKDNFKGIALGVSGFDPSRSIPVQYVERAIDGSMKVPVKYQSIFNDPDNPTSAYNRDTRQIFIDPNMQDIESTLLHERTHALNHQLPQRIVGQQGYEMSPIESKVRDVMMPWYKENEQDLDEYWDDPVEIYARMMQMRYRLNLDPKKKVTKDDLKKWRKDGLLRQYEMGVYDDDTLLQLFNEVADNRQLQNNQRNTYVIPTDIGLGYV